jgi:hypothetical protein
MRTRTAVLGALLALAAAGGRTSGGEAGPAPAPVEYRPGRQIGRLANRAVVESSGLAASRVNAGVFWTHNDSGGRPELYAFNEKGEDLGTFHVPGGTNRDWEDIASFRSGGKGHLVVADTGDNARRHGRYTLYLCEEPELKPAVAGGARPAGGDLKLVRTVEFTYGDGGSYDGESVAVEPDGRRVYLASRDRADKECRIFVLDLYKGAEGAEPIENPKAREIARHAWRDVTAMDISGDGQRAVLQTYSEAYQFVRAPGQTWEQAFKGKPTVVALPPRPQGEGLSYGPDGRTLYLTSESATGCPLFILEPKPADDTKPGK